MIVFGGFVVGLFVVTLLSLNLGHPTIGWCGPSYAEEVQEFSPYPREILGRTEDVTFNGAFYGEEENIYRRLAAPEVDQAWRDLGIKIGPLHIATEDAESMRIPKDRFKVEDETLGPSYLVTVEVFHQIHCLDLLRKSLWFNAPYYIGLGEHEFGNHGDTLRDHVTHCLDILRQVLMCNADVGLVPQIPLTLTNGSTIPFPDFSRPHKCRNYAAIKEWAVENSHEHWREDHGADHGGKIM